MTPRPYRTPAGRPAPHPGMTDAELDAHDEFALQLELDGPPVLGVALLLVALGLAAFGAGAVVHAALS